MEEEMGKATLNKVIFYSACLFMLGFDAGPADVARNWATDRRGSAATATAISDVCRQYSEGYNSLYIIFAISSCQRFQAVVLLA